jgi:mono/diheme cytochrome c family protein
MTPVVKATAIVLGLAVVAGLSAVGYVVASGLSALEQPGTVERLVARGVRRLVVSRRARGLTNPVAGSAKTLIEARAHYADHCASCHANDGSGNTAMGQGLYPKAPDMRQAATQNLTDGELFWIIENGIRFTGMPGWATGTREGQEESWALVHFMRRLPTLSAEEIAEMEDMNPRSPQEIRQELEQERFLEGASDGADGSHSTHGASHD